MFPFILLFLNFIHDSFHFLIIKYALLQILHWLFVLYRGNSLLFLIHFLEVLQFSMMIRITRARTQFLFVFNQFVDIVSSIHWNWFQSYSVKLCRKLHCRGDVFFNFCLDGLNLFFKLLHHIYHVHTFSSNFFNYLLSCDCLCIIFCSYEIFQVYVWRKMVSTMRTFVVLTCKPVTFWLIFKITFFMAWFISATRLFTLGCVSSWWVIFHCMSFWYFKSKLFRVFEVLISFVEKVFG